MIAVSLAVAHAAAAAAGVPLWRHLAGDRAARLPLPEIQLFGGGAHAARRVDIQDFMVVAVGARTFAEALDMTAEVYRAAGLLLADKGRLAGVADEGGYWPAFDGNEEGAGARCRGDRAGRLRARRATSRSRSTSPLPISARAAAIASPARTASSTATA